MKKVCLILMSLPFFYSCLQDAGKNKITSSNAYDTLKKSAGLNNKDSLSYSEKIPLSTEGCEALLDRLIHTSSYDPNLDLHTTDKWAAIVNEVADSIITIEIRYGAVSDSNHFTMGWVRLNIKDLTLLDITNDIEHPVRLKYNKVLLDSLTRGCIFTNTSN